MYKRLSLLTIYWLFHHKNYYRVRIRLKCGEHNVATTKRDSVVKSWYMHERIKEIQMNANAEAE